MAENNKLMNNNNINVSKIKKQQEELDGYKQMIFKETNAREKTVDLKDELTHQKTQLEKENQSLRNQQMHLSEELSKAQRQFNELNAKYRELVLNQEQGSNTKANKSSIMKSKTKNELERLNNPEGCLTEGNYEALEKELKEAKKEINSLKKKNEDLFNQLEEKEIKNNCGQYKSEDGNISNYEEEFDLRKMAKGAKDKNRSQDINIDYPGVQQIKEKYRELDFYYNSIEGLVKKLLVTSQCTAKNKTYVTELCRLVGFDLETTNKIVNNKGKKNLLGLFPK